MRIAPQSIWFTLLLGIFAGVPALSIDLSAPTLAILPAALATSVTTAGLSLSLFMVGFAGGQFVGGRASDRRGRRPVLLVALLVYTFGGIGSALAASGPELAAARLVQGAGAGACAVQAFAIVQDLFEGELARRKQSYVSVVLTVMPMLAPALGALMITVWGWRSVHAVLAVAGIVLGLVVFSLLAESRPPGLRAGSRGLGFADGFQMLRGPYFRRIAIVNALSYGTVFAYIAGAPVVVMNEMGYPASVYAAVFAGTALALSAGAATNAMLARRGFASNSLVWPGLIAQAGSTLALAMACTASNTCQPALVLPPLLISSFARGVLSPNLVYLAISRHRETAGLASAMIGLTQLLVGAGASAVVAALLPRFGYAGVATPMAVLACAAAVLWPAAAWRKKGAELGEMTERQ